MQKLTDYFKNEKDGIDEIKKTETQRVTKII